MKDANGIAKYFKRTSAWRKYDQVCVGQRHGVGLHQSRLTGSSQLLYYQADAQGMGLSSSRPSSNPMAGPLMGCRKYPRGEVFGSLPAQRGGGA